MAVEVSADAYIKGGKLFVRDRDSFDQAFAKWKDGDVTLRVEKLSATRSLQANRYYFGVVLDLMAQETGHTKEELHDDMCDRFLRRRLVYLHAETGQIEEREIAGRSSKLSVGEFYEFVEKVRQFAGEFLCMTIPDPDPSHWRVTTKGGGSHAEAASAQRR